ncbi:MAG: 1,4-alpha-glucan branching protein GlgB [Verrucomicrobia bacterium]|nr:1,4-alpha-glucan branching protein GlgB [Verrucomicrobiota bacterium]
MIDLTYSPVDIQRLLASTHHDPFAFLGPHRLPDGRWVVRVFQPRAESVKVVLHPRGEIEAPRVHSAGLFEAIFESNGRPSYVLEIAYADGTPVWRHPDPYSYGPLFGELDLHLFAEGNHHRLYDEFGAQVREIGGIRGVSFAVWAPNARRVSVVGDFNHWDGRVHPMRRLLGCGVWEIFLPGLPVGSHYKFEILDARNNVRLKGDPFAFFSQNGKQTASIVYDLGNYVWADDEWMEKRAKSKPYEEPMSIYEVHLGSWQWIAEEGRPMSYLELADRLIPYAVEMGFTHLELMPVAEHPFVGSWGYQITGYFSPTSRFGPPDDFRQFVDRCHQAGLGVILDWVPGHFPKDEHGLARFDGTALYEHADPRQGEHSDWGTLIFNYGRNEVRNFLIANGLYWLDQFHIDGLRVDAVASMLYLDYSRKPGQWVPNAYGGRENLEAVAFLKRFNEVAYQSYPGVVTIAEESTSWPGVSRPTYTGGLGFGMKWNMGWMHDTLKYFSFDPIFRRFHQGMLTFSMMYAYSEHFVMPLSHDEVVHGKGSLINKMPGDEWQKFANLRLLFAYQWMHPGRKLIFQGSEFAQVREWDHDRSLDWHLTNEPRHLGITRLLQQLNHLYRHHPALHELEDSYDGFEWIDFSDSDNSVLAFMRKPRAESAGAHRLVVVLNFTPVPRLGYRMGFPSPGGYTEVLNTDATEYGGSGVGNAGFVQTEPIRWHRFDHSAPITLPPLAAIAFLCPGQTAPPVEEAAAEAGAVIDLPMIGA